MQEILQLIQALKSDEVKQLIDEGADAVIEVVETIVRKLADSELIDIFAGMSASYVTALEKQGFTRDEAVAMATQFMSTLAAQARSKSSK